MQLGLDRESDTPLVEQIVRALARWLMEGKVRAGVRMPSIRQLATDNKVSPSSVVEAYARLVAQGAVVPRQGSGFFASESPASVVSEQPGNLEDPRWAQFDASPALLRLGCGWVPTDWRDADCLGHAIRRVTREDPTALFSYNSPMGLPALRTQLQRRLSQVHIHAQTQQILTTQGASHALDLIVRTLLRPGDTVIMEDPGYYNLFNLLALQKVQVLAVPRAKEGPDPDRLEALLRDHRPKLMFVNSMYQNPTGTSLSPRVAHRLLRLAEQHDFLLVEDDIYADFQNGPSTRLAALDGLNRVIYLASFSKTLSCSLRVGYVAGPPTVMPRLAEVAQATGLGTQRFAESVVATLLASGAWRKSLERLRQRLATSMAHTLKYLAEHRWEVFAEPQGGMFVWARYPGATPVEYAAKSAALGILLTPGEAFRPFGQPTDWLRLNVAYCVDPRARAFFKTVATPRAG